MCSWVRWVVRNERHMRAHAPMSIYVSMHPFRQQTTHNHNHYHHNLSPKNQTMAEMTLAEGKPDPLAGIDSKVRISFI